MPAKYKKVTINMSDAQRDALEMAFVNSPYTNRSEFLRFGLEQLSKYYGVRFPDDIRKHTGTLAKE